MTGCRTDTKSYLCPCHAVAASDARALIKLTMKSLRKVYRSLGRGLLTCIWQRRQLCYFCYQTLMSVLKPRNVTCDQCMQCRSPSCSMYGPAYGPAFGPACDAAYTALHLVLHIMPHMIIESMISASAAVIYQCCEQELFWLQVTSLGELSSPSIVLFDVVQSRIKELGETVSPQQKREIKSAYEALGYKDHADAAGV